MWVCDVDWEREEGTFLGAPYTAIKNLGCPDGSEDYHGGPPCNPPVFTPETCDLLTGTFTQAREYCLEAHAEYDKYYDWDVYDG